MYMCVFLRIYMYTLYSQKHAHLFIVGKCTSQLL